MLFFSGFAAGSPFIPRLADVHGRKKVFWMCMFIQLLSTCCFILVPAGPEGNESKYFYIVIINFFIQGLCASGRPAIGYIYMCEFAPQKHHTLMGTVWNCSEGAIFIYLTLYYYYISKEWVWTQVYGAATNVVTCILLFWIPESPKYLYSEKRYKECVEVLQKMKKFNQGS
jgi:MFS family permease